MTKKLPPSPPPPEKKPRGKTPAPTPPAPSIKPKTKKQPKPTQDKGEVLPKEEQPLPSDADKPLTPVELAVIDHYMLDPNGTKAYMAVKPNSSEPAARVSAARMLAKPNVAAEIAKRRAERANRLEIDADKLVKEVYEMALADTRELVQYLRTCCRHCFGTNHGYQRTTFEMDADREAHDKAEDEREAIAAMKNKAFHRRDFNEKGGTGYDGRKDPNPDCPACWGRGIGTPVIADTRTLSKAAVALYAGVKETKDGLELMKHDKKGALDMMWKHQGLYEVDNAQKGETKKHSKEELEVLYEAARQEAETQRLAMQKRRKQFEADDAKERGNR